MTVSPYDLYLGDASALQGYRCRLLTRDSAPQIAPRFSTGSQGQTDLDLLKSVSVDNVAGGMFQRNWQDPQRVARAMGVFNKATEYFHPTPPISSATNLSLSYYPLAKVESQIYSFIAYGAFSSGTCYNQIYKVTASGGVSSITLPAALASNTVCNISDLALHKGFLYVSSQSPTQSGTVNNWRYDIANNTWQDLTGYGVIMREMRGVLYHINKQSNIYAMTNETAAGAATYTFIDVAGFTDNNAVPSDAAEFNGALWIAKPDGVYRFDGVRATKVLDLPTGELKVWNGALYFVSGFWLYRFDGATVTRLQWFGSIANGEQAFNKGVGRSMALSANSDYLFVATAAALTPFTFYDKNDYYAASTGVNRVYTYDGAAFSLIYEASELIGTSFNPGVLAALPRLYVVYGTIDPNQGPGGAWTTHYKYFSLDQMLDPTAVTSGCSLEITTSEFDDGFPNIYKSIELFDVSYSGMVSGDSLAVSYQYYDGKTWSSWITAGTITSSSANTIEVVANKLFKRIKVNVKATLTNGSTLTVKGVSMRYTLQPRMRWRWQATIMAEGNGIVQDRNNNAITGDSNAYTNQIIRSVKQKTPIFMLSPDYGKLNTAATSAATSFVVGGQASIYTDPYNEYPLVAVKNHSGAWEILRVTNVSYDANNDQTTITVAERGYLGITAAALDAGAEFHLAYKVYITRLLRDQPTLDDNTYNEQTSGESQLQREFMLEITEV